MKCHIKLGPLQIWPAEMKNNLGLEHTEKKYSNLKKFATMPFYLILCYGMYCWTVPKVGFSKKTDHFRQLLLGRWANLRKNPEKKRDRFYCHQTENHQYIFFVNLPPQHLCHVIHVLNRLSFIQCLCSDKKPTIWIWICKSTSSTQKISSNLEFLIVLRIFNHAQNFGFHCC